ncbi:hypothetical protein GWO43_22070 [candidate division KSB1 bacterium]|nr:hypothetical protein [candidate division KSB1 bacterium]NIR72551.1 hypothetical protein [candidate division KSB1 bacterium]NIS27303.1 hypothetical protein [candidate division KSB1 bacterium]NIT73513.1 hypothetical protein [candidate division KSB1 bacterium]NIU28033.1 hypothetical protein [candidate division KSB1 bacterium]
MASARTQPHPDSLRFRDKFCALMTVAPAEMPAPATSNAITVRFFGVAGRFTQEQAGAVPIEVGAGLQPHILRGGGLHRGVDDDRAVRLLLQPGVNKRSVSRLRDRLLMFASSFQPSFRNLARPLLEYSRRQNSALNQEYRLCNPQDMGVLA